MAGLEDLYREIILDHYRSPRNRGNLPTPPAHPAGGAAPRAGRGRRHPGRATCPADSRGPRNRGTLPTPPAHRVEGFNPLCGDEVILYVDIDDSGRVTDIKVDGQGCSISQSSASMMTAAVKGRTEDETRELIRACRAVMSIREGGLDGNVIEGGVESHDGESGPVAPDPAVD